MDSPDPTQQRIEIGNRLRQARELAGLSQGQVARMLNLHRPSVSEMEAGRRRVSADELQELARIYDVGVEWLTSGDAAPSLSTDPRYQLAARELAKLKPEDVERLLSVLSALRKRGGDV